MKLKKLIMKRITTLASLFLILCGFAILPSDCGTLLFFKEGTSTTMTSYNDDGKITGSSKTVYSKVTKLPGGVSVTANQENFDKKGKSNSKSEFTIKCDKGVLYFDMKSMMTDQQAESYKDFEMTVEGADKEIPSEFVVGSTLKDANMKITVKTKDGMPMPMMNMSFKVTNRKIEAKESITTPAGTFECYKITEDIETKTMFTIKMKSVNWFSHEAGNVKTETYKESGKYMGKSELTEIKK